MSWPICSGGGVLSPAAARGIILRYAVASCRLCVAAASSCRYLLPSLHESANAPALCGPGVLA